MCVREKKKWTVHMKLMDTTSTTQYFTHSRITCSVTSVSSCPPSPPIAPATFTPSRSPSARTRARNSSVRGSAAAATADDREGAKPEVGVVDAELAAAAAALYVAPVCVCRGGGRRDWEERTGYISHNHQRVKEDSPNSSSLRSIHSTQCNAKRTGILVLAGDGLGEQPAQRRQPLPPLAGAPWVRAAHVAEVLVKSG